MDKSRMAKTKRKRTGKDIEPAPADACPVPADEPAGEHWRFCLRCGHELINEKCKLRCPRCHYFMSCSDFDFAG